ncbi:MAG: nitroreductase family protein [Candidatus Aenigmarchaeota archaeon]|nr:nitroreductase family protein [Candidatus Aenigmarchaeota archaeon]
MPFKTIAKFGKKKKEVEIPEEIEEIKEEERIPESIISLIKTRRSVRKYNKKPVDMKLILKILETAGYAPSSGNYQPWEFVVVRNPKIKGHLVEACYNQKWMLDAPVFIVTCINNRLAGATYGERGLRLYGIQSVAAAIENILLAAESLGLSTCWIGAFSENMVAKILECPEHVRPCAIITLGYSDKKPSMPARQSMEDFVHIEKFGNNLIMERVKKESKPTYMKFKG